MITLFKHTDEDGDRLQINTHVGDKRFARITNMGVDGQADIEADAFLPTAGARLNELLAAIMGGPGQWIADADLPAVTEDSEYLHARDLTASRTIDPTCPRHDALGLLAIARHLEAEQATKAADDARVDELAETLRLAWAQSSGFTAWRHVASAALEATGGAHR